MNIEVVEATAVVAPMARPLRTASGSVTEAPLVLVDLVTTEGVTGRAYLFAYYRLALEPLRRLVVSLGEVIAGATVVPVDLGARLRSSITLLGSRSLVGMAIAGLDMAAWDALAQAAGLPLVRLLGGTPRRVPAYESLGMLGPGEAGEAAARAVEAGFPALKVRLGFPTLEEDLAAVRAAREALPGGTSLMVDYNQSLPVAEAVRRGRALDGEGVTWIEEPVRADDFAGCARVAGAVDTPVQIGENFHGTFEMQAALAARASDLVMPDAQQIGGVTGWLRAAGLAEAAGVPMSSHLFPEASAHLLCITPTAHWLEWLDLAGPVLAEPAAVVDGAVEAPDRPGLGLTWDPAAVTRFRAGA